MADLDSLQPGEVLIISEMPFPIAVGMIERHQEGSHFHHCAVSLGGKIYEAAPPFVRTKTFSEYHDLLTHYSLKRQGWRIRNDRLLTVDVWHGAVSDAQLAVMQEYAETQLGKPYGLLANYLWDFECALHCSEYCGRILESAGIGTWPTERSKTTPLDVVRQMQAVGWVRVDKIVYRLPG